MSMNPFFFKAHSTLMFEGEWQNSHAGVHERHEVLVSEVSQHPLAPDNVVRTFLRLEVLQAWNTCHSEDAGKR